MTTNADASVPPATADAQELAAPSTGEAAAEQSTPKPKRTPKAEPKAKKPALTFVVVPKTLEVRAYRGVPKVDFKTGEVGIWEVGHMSRLSNDTLVGLYNKVRPEKPITKIGDRAIYEKQLYPALEVLGGKPLPGGGKTETTTSSETETMPAAAKKGATKSKKTATKKTATKKAAAPKGEGRRGRASAFSGKTITKVKDSTRQEGSLCHASWVIIDRAKNGISYEDFLAKGGRRKDLAWELAHGNVKVK